MNLSPDSPAPEPESEPAKPAPLPAGARDDGELFVVGIGASAGGLEALSEVLRRLPASCNLAIVIVQHLDPHHESLLVELLQREATLPVGWANRGHTVEPGHVYVAPRGKYLEFKGGLLHVREPAAREGGNIDYFFQSLAAEAGHCAVGVLLSGNGNDGTAGAKAIKGAGGIVLAQDPSTADFPSMPRAAIDAHLVDAVFAPAVIADELVKLAQHAPLLWSRIAAPDDASPAGGAAEQLAGILRAVALRTGVDFADYKPTTVKRRLARQMMLAKTAEPGDYLRFLHKNRDEVERLYDSLLINVTEFFRDPECFEFLRRAILPAIIAQHADDTPIRMWVPGCSTGEEVYSLGILLHELLEEHERTIPVQIFGTDISEHAIAHARAGNYAGGDLGGVSTERRLRYFQETDHGFLIRKVIRDMCIFARQNVVKDSPFSRLDLISCRNLLIYLNPESQRKLMPIFHYALNPTGFLVLGTSESVGAQAELYRLIDRRFRVYSRKSTSRVPTVDFAVDPSPRAESRAQKKLPPMPEEPKEPFDVIREADRIVLHRHGPVGVLVNDELEILQFRGDVSPYLAPPPGRATLNLLKMAGEGFAAELHSALDEARAKHHRVHRPAVSVTHGETLRHVDVDVTPIDGLHNKDRFFLVLFSMPAGAPKAEKPKPGGRKSAGAVQAEQLREELHATRNYFQSTIEKHDATNQALRAANEEIQSSNEELQSTNEELETAKEELQSTNEELTTVNEELHSRQLELIQLNNDLTNFANSVHLPIIILDRELRIRRFTPAAERVLNLIPTDVGRPLSDINVNLKVKDLMRLMTEVTESLVIKEIEVQDQEGRWFSMRLRPYKTTEGKIDGVVLTLVDIHDLKQTFSAMEDARDFAQAVIESASAPLAIVTSDLRIKAANDAFAGLFRSARADMDGRFIFDLLHGDAADGDLRAEIGGILPKGCDLTERVICVDFPGAVTSRVRINARQIKNASRSYPMILLSLRRAD